MSLLSRWRWLFDPPAPGAWNLAVDEALLIGAERSDAHPVLRCYAWAPPCLSLGRFQSTDGLDRVRAASMGIDVARRPTGGRAILHDDELTYSIVAPPGHELSRLSVRDSYRLISTTFQTALQRLGATTTAAPRRAAGDSAAGQRRNRPDCFAIASDYEILADGRKLIGSAQVRRAGALLQHGSILLDQYRSPDLLFGRPAPEVPPATLRSALGRSVTRNELIEAIGAAFRDGFGIRLEPDVLSEHETRLARQLFETKYSNEDWTFVR